MFGKTKDQIEITRKARQLLQIHNSSLNNFKRKRVTKSAGLIPELRDAIRIIL